MCVFIIAIMQMNMQSIQHYIILWSISIWSIGLSSGHSGLKPTIYPGLATTGMQERTSMLIWIVVVWINHMCKSFLYLKLDHWKLTPMKAKVHKFMADMHNCMYNIIHLYLTALSCPYRSGVLFWRGAVVAT